MLRHPGALNTFFHNIPNASHALKIGVLEHCCRNFKLLELVGIARRKLCFWSSTRQLLI